MARDRPQRRAAEELMELVVRIGEREERVVVERRGDGGHYSVRIGSVEHLVESAAVGTALLRSLLVGGRQREVAVYADGDGRYRVTANGEILGVEVLDPLARLAQQGAGRDAADGPQRVTAYMPGRVVSVLVAAGDEVQPGQGVVVLEAMKMQNEIQSERAGVVGRVFVRPGQAVDGGDPLFELA
ncbi:MAG: biotin/lipoyl-containing protein [Acidobacteriota bacterium]